MGEWGGEANRFVYKRRKTVAATIRGRHGLEEAACLCTSALTPISPSTLVHTHRQRGQVDGGSWNDVVYTWRRLAHQVERLFLFLSVCVCVPMCFAAGRWPISRKVSADEPITKTGRWLPPLVFFFLFLFRTKSYTSEKGGKKWLVETTPFGLDSLVWGGVPIRHQSNWETTREGGIFRIMKSKNFSFFLAGYVSMKCIISNRDLFGYSYLSLGET